MILLFDNNKQHYSQIIYDNNINIIDDSLSSDTNNLKSLDKNLLKDIYKLIEKYI